MEKHKLTNVLSSLYEPSLSTETAWEAYNNFVELFLEGDAATTNYLCTICELSSKQRLLLRHKIAEQGFELTPNELNQYVLLILMALTEYMELKGA
jgi:hypothetical protein|tara:strand:+ start:136 stop:423 length:288 start_codon:yes stop_codon:yes gene_type:complete